jgi:L-glyceraldehyde 3-phosphate reductase
MVQLAIAWILRRPEVTCVLVGAKDPDQVKGHLDAANITFSNDELQNIDTILKDTPKG